MMCPPLPKSPIVENWLERHRSPSSFLLHQLGIPIAVVGFLIFPICLPLFSWKLGVLAAGLFVGGYALQLSGHYLEGTDPGEVIYFKRRLGLPYVEFAPGRAPGAAAGLDRSLEAGAAGLVVSAEESASIEV